jgi:hypothetical protein
MRRWIARSIGFRLDDFPTDAIDREDGADQVSRDHIRGSREESLELQARIRLSCSCS